MRQENFAEGFSIQRRAVDVRMLRAVFLRRDGEGFAARQPCGRRMVKVRSIIAYS